MWLQANHLVTIVLVVSVVSVVSVVFVVFVVFFVIIDVPIAGVSEDDAVKTRQVDVLVLGVVCKRDRVFVLGAHAKFSILLVLVAIGVVRLGKSVSQVV